MKARLSPHSLEHKVLILGRPMVVVHTAFGSWSIRISERSAAYSLPLLACKGEEN